MRALFEASEKDYQNEAKRGRNACRLSSTRICFGGHLVGDHGQQSTSSKRLNERPGLARAAANDNVADTRRYRREAIFSRNARDPDS